MKSLILLIISSIFVVSCSKNTGTDADNKVIGQWKLTGIKYYYGINSSGVPGPYIIDYSSENIVYSFKKNGILEVAGNGDGTAGFPDGKYPYQFKYDYLNGPAPGAEKTDLVIIQQTKWVFNGSESEMSISTSYFDGPELIFKRVGS